MAISDRIEGSVENWSGKWADRLGNWINKVWGLLLQSTIGIILPPPVMERLFPVTEESSQAAFDWLVTTISALSGAWSSGGPIGRIYTHAQEREHQSYRLDPLSVITAWRRDQTTYNQYFEDLKDQGWSEDRIEALKFVTQYYPAPADLVRWQAREVFEPTMVERYGLDAEAGGIQRDAFYRAGMTDEQIGNYWRAHWEHASWIQVVEMLRRGQLTEAEVWDWFRLVEIPPYWRDKLIAISREVPTRVDVRRFWEYGTIDESRLREIYTAQGYYGKDLDDYVLWTKVYTLFPDLMTRFKNNWISLDDVRAELQAAGMTPEKVEELIQTKVSAEASVKLTKERDLTMSQITRGVKKGVITRDQGAVLLLEMGYDYNEAMYILAVDAPPDDTAEVIKIRELSKSDVLKGLKVGELTEEEALGKLLELRYRQDDADLILRIFKASIEPPEEPKLREESKTDIVKAVKEGLITPEDGYLRLLDVGFSPDASQFILMVHAESSPFSPMNFSEFKGLTDQYRQLSGIGGRAMPEDLKSLADQVVRLTGEAESVARELKVLEDAITDETALQPEERDRLESLRRSKRRVDRELSRTRNQYDDKLTAWRHREE